ncbi:MAG: molecular chaperone TorD family protein [Campylobacterales bacterium]|nr:molecular chaperone TorD family protein [Campylobacterales bacterium]
MANNEINKARVVYYGLFASLFTFFENTNNYESIKNTLKVLGENPLDKHSKKALDNMNSFLEKKSSNDLKDEMNIIFYSLTSSYIPVSASYYDEARDDGKKKLEMLDFVLKSKFRRDENIYKESEDNIAFILSFMSKLINEELQEDKNSQEIAKDVFKDILNEVIDSFINRVYAHENAEFYKDLALVLKVFMEFERHFYSLKAPIKEDVQDIKRLSEKDQKKPAEKRVKKNFEEFASI